MWRTINYLSVVSTIIKSLGNISNNREQVIVIIIQPIQKFYIDYLINTTIMEQTISKQNSLY